MSAFEVVGWDRLRHGGLLLDAPRLGRVAEYQPNPLPPYEEHELRRLAIALPGGSASASDFVTFVLEKVCGFTTGIGSWQRGSQVGADWGRRTVTGETMKPRQLWRGENGAILPVFFDAETRLGIGRGRKAASQAVQWLRAGTERLALLTNGRQWRLVFAGLDFDAWCEWDVDLWFAEGGLSPQVQVLRTLLQPALWTPPAADTPAPLLQAIIDSRKGQAELSAVLGERVREAVELLVQAHGEILKERCGVVDPADIYRAAVRIVMRLVVVLFAESRELLPRDNVLYHSAYGLSGLLEDLEKVGARGGNRLARSWNAWPRVLALFHLVHQGSHHPALPVPAYGGELFAPGEPSAADGLSQALAVFETAALDRELLSDRDVYKLLERITRTKVKIRQGRANTWVPAPVDFSDLSSEYIGILYEGLLDFELKTAPAGDPVVFLSVGKQPALPLSRLEVMDDKVLASLFEAMKDTSKSEADEEEGEEGEPAEEESVEDEESVSQAEDDNEDAADAADDRHTTRTRAESWARRAVEVGKLARKPKGAMTPEKRLVYEDIVARKARQLVVRVILPGEWYVVRWGGTRKGSGTFYTRPGLAVPTVQRTLRPLAYVPPVKDDGSPDLDAPHAAWTPKFPEEILALKVCDPACGSGTFPVAALRFLTDALFASLHHHGRVSADGERVVIRLLEGVPTSAGRADERLGRELLPCRPDDALFEPRLKALLRRHVVERSIYGVDLDPLAVELCRLALWIETMDRTLPFSFLDHKVKCGNALVGAWFDQFEHYPVMAWKNREGGDKNHTNGIHFEKDARTRAFKTFVKELLAPDLRSFLAGRTLFSVDLQRLASGVHTGAIGTLSRLHDLPVQDSAERARLYREELLGSQAYRSLKSAMHLWCACWFWPADDLEHAPLPTTFAASSEATLAIVERIATKKRFFHWELEFPDVFRAAGSGFDAILGNPPWENLQPNPEEFFSNADPLFRTYGRLEKLARQREMFAPDEAFETEWLDYSADFNSFSHWVGHSGNPCGDPEGDDGSDDSFAIGRGGKELHSRWRDQRRLSKGYASTPHPFRHQVGRLFTYKLFLEQSHALLSDGGRLGQIVPSGIYSDAWSQPLRELFLDHCRWEWIFGFENRDKVFEIDGRFKFNPIILAKGGTTAGIRTAFMRRKLEDWERAEVLATAYSRAQIERFSPHSKTILEIQSPLDLEILEKIYADSVLLGDEGPDGWGIKYKLEFMMNTDAHLFPPRPKWEADGYRPDEYSRWLKGDWHPIAELWAKLGVTSLSEGERRCAQQPYGALPIPRADIPAGIVLSREADSWLLESWVKDLALPLYEGRMIGQYDFSEKGWISGKGRGSVWETIDWREKSIRPQFLMAASAFAHYDFTRIAQVGQMRVSSGTNTRTLITTALPKLPCGDKVATLTLRDAQLASILSAVLNSYVSDYQTRMRIAGLQIDQHLLFALAVPRPRLAADGCVFDCLGGLFAPSPLFAGFWCEVEAKRQSSKFGSTSWRSMWSITPNARTTQIASVNAVAAVRFGLNAYDLGHVLRDCDRPVGQFTGLDPKGLWRVDKDKYPELRDTVLTIVAFRDLAEKIRACDGDRERGIEAFLVQNEGAGWMLPEQLRLDDFGLGHDERAKYHQPVASRFGPRFYDWQLAQPPEESWRECHLHARNLLGEAVYQQLLSDIEAAKRGETGNFVEPESPPRLSREGTQVKLFE